MVLFFYLIFSFLARALPFHMVVGQREIILQKLARLSKYLFFIDFTYPHVSFTEEAAIVL